jgi:hypothetical protein
MRRAENQPEVCLFDGGKLVRQAGKPSRAATILLPDGIFGQIKAKL